MDLMTRRSVLLASGMKVIDTSPIIEKYGYRLGYRNTEIEDNDSCIVQVYAYPKTNQTLTMVSGYLGGQIHIYRDGMYLDWWSWNSGAEYERKCMMMKISE